MPAGGGERRVEQIERVARWPLLVLAVVFIPVVFVEYAGGFSARQQYWATVAEYAIHGIFAAEFLLRLNFVDKKKEYAKENWYDVGAIIVPPVRLLRSYRKSLG